MVGRRRRGGGRGAARSPSPPDQAAESEEDDDMKRAMELSMMATDPMAEEEEEMDADLAAALKASLEEPLIKLESRMVEGPRRTSEDDLQEALRISLLEAEEKKKREEEDTKEEKMDKSPGEKEKKEVKAPNVKSGGSPQPSGAFSDDDFDAMCSDSKPLLKHRISKADLSEACSSSSGWLGKGSVSRSEASSGLADSDDDDKSKTDRVSSSKNTERKKKAAEKISLANEDNEVESTVDKTKNAKNKNTGTRKRPKRGELKNGGKEDAADEEAFEPESTVKTAPKKGRKRGGQQSRGATNEDLLEPDQVEEAKNCLAGSTSMQNGIVVDSSDEDFVETSEASSKKKSKKRTKMRTQGRGGRSRGEGGDGRNSEGETANSADSTCPEERQDEPGRSSRDNDAEASCELDDSVYANELTIEVSDSEDPPFVISDNSDDDSDYEVSTTVPERERRVPEVAAAEGGGPLLDREAVTRRMQGVFQSGLEIHFSGEEMEACRAIATPLFPHQRVALAWMFRHENKETDGMRGGILADDMGLGKTLTVIALIFTNHWDGKPLAKPDIGFTRPPLTVNSGTRRGRKGKTGAGWKPKGGQQVEGVGSKAVAKKATITNVFDKFKKVNSKGDDDRNGKFSFQKDRFIADDSSEDDEDDSEGSMKDFIDDQSSDEFDDMTKSKKSSMQEKKTTVFERMKSSSEDDSEDEEFKKMSTEEQMLAMIPRSLDGICDIDNLESESEELNPRLNLDGFLDESDGDDDCKRRSDTKGASSESDNSDVEPEPEKSKARNKREHSDGSEESPPKRSKSNSPAEEMYESDASLPEVEEEVADGKEKLETSDSDEKEVVRPAPRESGEPGLKLLIPPKEIASRGGRRRPTLLVCPTSLISHWVEQLQSHVHKSVAVKLKVHHGTSKSFYAGDLESHDIVVTTYGTLAAEFTYGERSGSPLLKAKWLRVVLDEGHMVKNHLSKSHKAVLELDTLRKWVVTGTPIQNNLMELWSLTNFLDFGMYAGKQQMRVFKQHIVRPCKYGDPRGFERLQVLLEAICLRRSKTDKKPDGSLLVKLPKKTVLIRSVELSEEERLCYGIFHKQAADIVGRYDRRGQLMKNYAHIFAMMMRLRQLCCHRELIKEVNWGSVMKDKEGLKRQLEGFLATEEAANKEEGKVGEDSEEEKRLVAQLRQMIREGVTDDCSICLDDLKSPVITPCAHVFCKACIEAVIETMKPPACPLCRRTPMSSKTLLEAGHQEEGEEEEDHTLAAMEDIIVNASSSKINAVLKEIMRIGRDAPEDKIVVVSQFTSFLSVLQPLLQEKKFSYTRLDGTMSHQDRTRAVTLFQSKSKKSPKVMLLSLKAGGVGLNLTAANHLLLLDPAWNPASEWQCFDRTHRLGQKKDVTIYKYITKDTIEEKMIEIQSKKKDLISGAFHMDSEERRRERIADIRNIFSI